MRDRPSQDRNKQAASTSTGPIQFGARLLEGVQMFLGIRDSASFLDYDVARLTCQQSPAFARRYTDGQF
ncbi:hypothetical protein [Stieleria neptunia]|uniref:hypothetical protein n=1 Tax=Stieleria neptunia TaxID=2527979 RepID=UPI0011A24901|nr:hypothetical protein [Stieleria neptunia]